MRRARTEQLALLLGSLGACALAATPVIAQPAPSSAAPAEPVPEQVAPPPAFAADQPPPEAEQPPPEAEQPVPAADQPPPAAPDPQRTEPVPAPLDADDEAAIREALVQDASEEAKATDAEDRATAADRPAARGGQSLNPDLSLIADFALAWFSEDENLQTGAHDPSENGFNLQQLELSAGAAVDPYFRFDANIVFGLSEVEIEEAYATTLALPERLQLRAGQFLTRFGRLNASHPHVWDFVDQPFALGRIFGAEGNRGLGTELSWLSPLPWYVELVASVTDAGGEGSARSFFGADDPGVEDPLDLQYTFAIKQFFPLSDDLSLAWGLSSALGPNATGRDNRSEIYGTDLYLKWRPITFQSQQMLSLHTEWFYRRREVPEGVLQDVTGFAAATFRFAQRWAVAGRYEYGSAALDSDFDPAFDYLDPEWVEGRTRVAVNTTFWPTEFSRLRLQGSADLPEWQDEPIWAAFLALEVVTGAHGAHAF